MSVKAMAIAWEADLKPGAKLVFLAIADHADGHGTCWPGQEHIAEKCGMNRSTVNIHINDLVKSGYLLAEKRRGKEGRQASTIYTVNFNRNEVKPALENQTLETSKNDEKIKKPELEKITLELVDIENPALEIPALEIPALEIPALEFLDSRVGISNSYTFNESKENPKNITPQPEPTEKTPKELLAEHGITGQLQKDFLKIRTVKKLPLTPTAMKGICEESVKCGLSVLDAVDYATKSGWGSFKSQWYLDQNKQKAPKQQQPAANVQYIPKHLRNGAFGNEDFIDSTAKAI